LWYLSKAVDPCAGCGVRRSGRHGRRWRGLHRRRRSAVRGSRACLFGQRCGDREHVFGSAASTTRCGGWSARASMPPTARCPGRPCGCSISGVRCRAGASARRVVASACRCHHHHRPFRQRERAASVFWTDPRSPAVKRWPGCCAPGTQASNTAADRVRVLGWALESLPAGYRPTHTIPARRRSWCAPIPPAPPTHSPTRRHVEVGSPRLRRRLPASATRSRCSPPPTADIRRSIPTAASVTAPGSPRPPA
jgi:hypothetical protein